MKRALFPTIAMAVASAWSVAAHQRYPVLGGAQPEKITVVRRYDGAEGAHVEGLGVCRFDAANVECWDMEGNQDPALTQQVSSGLDQLPHRALTDRLAKPNRYFAMRMDLGANRTSWTGGAMGPSIGLRAKDGARINLEPVTAIPPATTFTLTIDDRAHAQSKTMPFRMGAKTTIEGCHIEIGAIDDITGRQDIGFFTIFGATLYWRVVIGATSERPSGALDIKLLDSEGAEIQFVDRTGKPVSHAVVRKATVDRDRTKLVPSEVFGLQPARFESSQQALPEAFAGVMDVDPKWVKSLSISILAQRQITIAGFPQDLH